MKSKKKKYRLIRRILHLRSLSLLSRSSKRNRPYKPPRQRHGAYTRNRGYALNEMDFLSDVRFHRMFRMTRLTFFALLDLINPLIERAEKAPKFSGGTIPTKTRLAVTLRWLAGGSYEDICFAFGISVSSFFLTKVSCGLQFMRSMRCLQLACL